MHPRKTRKLAKGTKEHVVDSVPVVDSMLVAGSSEQRDRGRENVGDNHRQHASSQPHDDDVVVAKQQKKMLMREDFDLPSFRAHFALFLLTTNPRTPPDDLLDAARSPCVPWNSSQTFPGDTDDHWKRMRDFAPTFPPPPKPPLVWNEANLLCNLTAVQPDAPKYAQDLSRLKKTDVYPEESGIESSDSGRLNFRTQWILFVLGMLDPPADGHLPRSSEISTSSFWARRWFVGGRGRKALETFLCKRVPEISLRRFWDVIFVGRDKHQPPVSLRVALSLMIHAFATGEHLLRRNYSERRRLAALTADRFYSTLLGVIVPSEILRQVFEFVGYGHDSLDSVALVCWSWYYVLSGIWPCIAIRGEFDVYRFPRIILSSARHITILQSEAGVMSATSYRELWSSVGRNALQRIGFRPVDSRGRPVFFDGSGPQPAVIDVSIDTAMFASSLLRCGIVLGGVRELDFSGLSKVDVRTVAMKFRGWESFSLGTTFPNLEIVLDPPCLRWFMFDKMRQVWMLKPPMTGLQNISVLGRLRGLRMLRLILCDPPTSSLLVDTLGHLLPQLVELRLQLHVSADSVVCRLFSRPKLSLPYLRELSLTRPISFSDPAREVWDLRLDIDAPHLRYLDIQGLPPRVQVSLFTALHPSLLLNAGYALTGAAGDVYGVLIRPLLAWAAEKKTKTVICSLPWFRAKGSILHVRLNQMGLVTAMKLLRVMKESLPRFQRVIISGTSRGKDDAKRAAAIEQLQACGFVAKLVRRSGKVLVVFRPKTK